MDGFLCIDKPKGMTSRRAINGIQAAVRPAKVGHAGTLDPLATGVLVTAIGKATRLISYVQRMPKTYEGCFRLGVRSDTEDITGRLIESAVRNPPELAVVGDVCRRFSGVIAQRPPAFSALKVQGKRAHQLARAGAPPVLAEREVTIHALEITRYAYPELEIRVCCGGGTYIRSLGRDIGELLECGAVMTDLRRTAIGCFQLAEAVAPDDCSDANSLSQHLMPMLRGVAEMTQVCVEPDELRELSYGRTVDLPRVDSEEVAAIDSRSRLAAVLTRATTPHSYRPAINFVAQ